MNSTGSISLSVRFSLCWCVGEGAGRGSFPSDKCYFNKMQETTLLWHMSIKGGRLVWKNDACYKQWSPQCHARPRSDPYFRAVVASLPIANPKSWYLTKFKLLKERWLGKPLLVWKSPAQESERKKFVVVGEACMSIFWPTPGFNGKTFYLSGFLTEKALISASAVPHR